MIWWKHLLSCSQPSFTSCISTPVSLQPVTETIRFARSCRSGLTTSGAAPGLRRDTQRFCMACARQCCTIGFQTRSHSGQSHECSLKWGKENWTRKESVPCGHAQLGCGGSGEEQGQQQWWDFCSPMLCQQPFGDIPSLSQMDTAE